MTKFLTVRQVQQLACKSLKAPPYMKPVQPTRAVLPEPADDSSQAVFTVPD